MKAISGLACLVGALLLGPFAWICFRWGELWFKFIPIAITLGLLAAGLILIRRRHQVISKRARILIVLFVVLLISSPALLVAKIRHDRWSLQARAKAFLSRAVPLALKPDSEGYMGYEYVGTNGEAEVHILGDSHALIERYATNGRIRWSAVIQGQFAITSERLWFPGAEDIESTNQEVRAYMAERNAILSEEWRMGFWQWVEDAIEMRQKIPEHEEEDSHPPVATNEVSR